MLHTSLPEIFTSDCPDQSGSHFPINEPYIIFKLPMAKKWENLFSYLDNLGFGILDKDKATATVTITGIRKILLAIDKFLAHENAQLNSSAHDEAIKYKNKCELLLNAKQKNPMAFKSKHMDEFYKNPQAVQLPESANTAYSVLKKTNPTKEYIFKLNPYGRSISEVEAFNARCYRLLLGIRHAKASSVHDKENNRRGVVSKKIPQFESFCDLDKAHNKPNMSSYKTSQNALLHWEVVKIWVAAYVEEENDLHAGNYGPAPIGPNATTFCVKIDDDQATWPLTSKYIGWHPEVSALPDLKVAPIHAFTVTERDIRNFPVLKDAYPCRWPDRSDNGLMEFDKLVEYKKYNTDKFYMFLKRILIPDDAYAAIGCATITSVNKRNKFVNHKQNKTIALRNVLLNMPEFQDYVIYNPQIISKIVKEFSAEEDASLRVNVNNVRINFIKIYSNILSTKISQFFAENSWIKWALIGAVIGLVVIALVVGIAAIGSAIVATEGLAAVPVAAAGMTLASLATLGGSLGGTVGMGSGMIAFCMFVTGLFGTMIEKCFCLAPELIEEENENNNQHDSDKDDETRKQSLESSASHGKMNLFPSASTQSPLAKHSILGHEINYQKIDVAIQFLSCNIAFFVASLGETDEETDDFGKWVDANDNILPFANDLNDALPTDIFYEQYQDAILGGTGNKRGLCHGDESGMRELLMQNPALIEALVKHADNSAIKQWCLDNEVSRDNITKKISI